MKNKEMEVIHRRLNRLEQIMIDESDKGHGHSAKAERASRAYQELEKQIEYIQFRKYKHLEDTKWNKKEPAYKHGHHGKIGHRHGHIGFNDHGVAGFWKP